MHTPNGWTATPAGGYGNLTRLTHDRCGSHRNVDIVLDEPGVRRFLASHECEDLREAREAREEREASERTANEGRDRELAELRTEVSELAVKLATVAAPTPVRLFVLDATTPDTLNATVDALSSADFLALATAVDAAQHRAHGRTALAEIREVLDTEAPAGLPVVGVLFVAEDYPSGSYFGARGTVLFSDGRIITLEFEEVEDTLREMYESVDPDATLAVDLRTDTFDFRYRKSAGPLHSRFGLAESEGSADDRLLDLVRTAINHVHDDGGYAVEDGGGPVGVQFKARREEDGYYLSSNDGMIVFADGTNAIATFSGVAALLAETTGCVGERYTVSVHLLTGTVTHTEDDRVALENRFNICPG